ncbi:MAG: hypothetical protein AB1515_08660, partial [Nitrospirota bacterium]
MGYLPNWYRKALDSWSLETWLLGAMITYLLILIGGGHGVGPLGLLIVFIGKTLLSSPEEVATALASQEWGVVAFVLSPLLGMAGGAFCLLGLFL